ncbi:MAG: M56 family metallopeptidase [Vicinamibacteria bacterium]
MTPLVAAVAAWWADAVVPLLWYGTIVGVLGLAVTPWLRRSSLTAALVVVHAALFKFYLPPVLQWPLAVVDQAASVVAPTDLAGAPGPLVTSLALVHAAGVLVAAGILARRALEVAGWRRRATPVSAGVLATDAEIVAGRAGGRAARVALLISVDVPGPVAIGVWRPVVLVPPGFETLPTPTRRAVLAHELAHHRHHDLLVEWWLSVAQAIWWFHPIVHALARVARDLREERCDAAVVRSGIVDAGTYCEALVAVARTRPAALTLAMRTRHSIVPRVRRLLAGPEARQGRARLAAFVAAGFVLTSVPAASERGSQPPATMPDDGVVIRHVIRTAPPATVIVEQQRVVR